MQIQPVTAVQDFYSPCAEDIENTTRRFHLPAKNRESIGRHANTEKTQECIQPAVRQEDVIVQQMPAGIDSSRLQQEDRKRRKLEFIFFVYQ